MAIDIYKLIEVDIIRWMSTKRLIYQVDDHHPLEGYEATDRTPIACRPASCGYWPGCGGQGSWLGNGGYGLVEDRLPSSSSPSTHGWLSGISSPWNLVQMVIDS